MTTPRTALEELERIADRMDAESSDDMPMQFAGMPSIYADIRKWAADIRTHGKALSEALGGWLPIETAPRDGTRIMLLHELNPVFGEWNPDKYANKPRPYWSHDQERIRGVRDARETPPTHWRPLPPPPTSAKVSEMDK